MRGALSNVWFDRYKISHDCLEHLESIDAMANSLGAVIQEEIRAGVPKHRMIIGTVSHTYTLILLLLELFVLFPCLFLTVCQIWLYGLSFTRYLPHDFLTP